MRKIKTITNNTQTKALSGFTLVELIVVVTILSILSTIGFVSYSSYLSGVRDTNRISQLKAIGDSLHLYETKKSLPLPDEKRLEIKDGAITIAIQGYVGKSVIETIGYTSEGKDPKDNTYFSYYLTKDRKYFQLLSFLEDQPETTSKLNNLNKLNKLNNLKTTQAIDYENRYPYVEGKKLGILTTETNQPIQETESGSLDISNVGNTKTYKSYLKTKEVITGNGTLFKDLGKVAKVGGRGYSSSGNTIVYKNLDGENISFTSHTFTNCGATGRKGPTLSQCKSSYNTNWDEYTSSFNIITQGIQQWIVPETGNYSIEVAGAKGGDNLVGNIGGLGIKMKGNFSLNKDEVLQIMVGQMGVSYKYTAGAGGGTFVAKGPNYTSANALIVGGGGGGAGNSGGNGDNAVTSTNGDSGQYSGGVNGNASTSTSNGGWGTSGGGFNTSSVSDSSQYYSSGKANGFKQNGLGASEAPGRDPNVSCSGAPGGFGGGGGGACNGGGGGGGYSGGGSGGGGGGSYNSGTSQTNGGTNNSHGYVKITKL